MALALLEHLTALCMGDAWGWQGWAPPVRRVQLQKMPALSSEALECGAQAGRGAGAPAGGRVPSAQGLLSPLLGA